jgi:hypothetical protein
MHTLKLSAVQRRKKRKNFDQGWMVLTGGGLALQPVVAHEEAELKAPVATATPMPTNVAATAVTVARV